MKQLSLIPAVSPAHGGELLLHRRKSARPLARKRPIHLILKARRKFGANSSLVVSEACRFAKKFDLEIYDVAPGFDHLHLVLTIPSRKNYIAFIRSLTGVLARRLGKGIWLLRPFTRVAQWGKAYAALKKYLEQNRREVTGAAPYSPRKDWYRSKRLRP